jgi:hypothetical protein
MAVGGPLRRLDDRVLPPIADALARLGRGARRVRIIRVVAVVISLTVVLVAVYAAGRQPPTTYAPAGVPVRLGVQEGDSIPLYIAASKTKLSQLIAATSANTKPPEYFALVSMTTYLTPQRLAAVLVHPQVQIAYVIMRVPSPEQTEIFQIYAPNVPQDIVREMQAKAEKKQQEVAEYDALLSDVRGATLTDQMQREQYKKEASIARHEANSYQSLCACVYAAVVHAKPDVLGQLAAQPGVRAVEPAPLQFSADLAVFLPPLPEQYDVAGPPPSS